MSLPALYQRAETVFVQEQHAAQGAKTAYNRRFKLYSCDIYSIGLFPVCPQNSGGFSTSPFYIGQPVG